jgi:hypothetical protein
MHKEYFKSIYHFLKAESLWIVSACVAGSYLAGLCCNDGADGAHAEARDLWRPQSTSRRSQSGKHLANGRPTGCSCGAGQQLGARSCCRRVPSDQATPLGLSSAPSSHPPPRAPTLRRPSALASARSAKRAMTTRVEEAGGAQEMSAAQSRQPGGDLSWRTSHLGWRMDLEIRHAVPIHCWHELVKEIFYQWHFVCFAWKCIAFACSAVSKQSITCYVRHLCLVF